MLRAHITFSGVFHHFHVIGTSKQTGLWERHNSKYKPQAALTSLKTLPFHLPYDLSCLYGSVQICFISLVCMAHFAPCVSSILRYCLLFYIYDLFSQICSNSLWCVCLILLSFSLSLVDKDAWCSFSGGGDDDNDHDDGKAACHAPSPPLYPPSTPTTQQNCSRAHGCCSQRSLLSLSNIWHHSLLPPSSEICFPWLWWLGFPGVPAIPLDF